MPGTGPLVIPQFLFTVTWTGSRGSVCTPPLKLMVSLLCLFDSFEIEALEFSRVVIDIVHTRMCGNAKPLTDHLAEASPADHQRQQLFIVGPEMLSVLSHHEIDSVDRGVYRL